jgi:hypothetical protein
MRGADQQQNHIFSYLSPEKRVRKDHPLRAIRAMVDEVLKQPSASRSTLSRHDGELFASARSSGLDLHLRLCRLQSGAHAQPGHRRSGGVSRRKCVSGTTWNETPGHEIRPSSTVENQKWKENHAAHRFFRSLLGCATSPLRQHPRIGLQIHSKASDRIRTYRATTQYARYKAHPHGMSHPRSRDRSFFGNSQCQ